MAVLGTYEIGSRPRDPTSDLAAYLAGEYRSGIPWRLTVRDPSATGQQLSDRLVSRLEVANALKSLTYRQRRVIELLYEEDRPVGEVAERLRISIRTVWADRLEALAAMVAVIYEPGWGRHDPKGALIE